MVTARDNQLDREPVNDQPASVPSVEDLFRTQTPRLLRFFRRWRGHADEPADLVQEVFLRVLAFTGFPSVGKPEAYMQRVARNLLYEKTKLARRHAAASHIPFDETLGLRLEPDQEEGLKAADMLHEYEKALLGLTARTRQVYLMHRVDGLSYKRIAESLQISESGVEKHIMKAIAHIDRVMGFPDDE